MSETDTIVVPVVLEDKVSAPAENAANALGDLSKKTQGIDGAMKGLNAVLKGLGGDSLAKFASGLKGAGAAAAAVTLQFETMKAGIETTMAVASTMLELGKGLYDRFKKIEEVEKVFRLKEGDEGVTRLERLTERAHAMGMEIDFARDLAAKLEQSWQGDDAEKLLGIIQDLSAGTADAAKSAESMEAKLKTLSTSAFVKGNFTKGFFKNAAGGAEVEVEFYKQLAKIKGVSVETAMALEKAGKISGQEWTKALGAADKAKNGVTEFGDKALAVSKGSLPAQVQRVTDSFKLMGDEIAKDVFGGKDMAETMGKLADSIDELAKDKDIQAFLHDVGDTFKTITKSVTEFATDAMPKVKDAFTWLKNNQDIVEAVGIGIAVVVGGLFLLFAGVFGVLGAIAMAIAAVVLVGTIVVGTIVYALMHAGDAWDWVKQKFNEGIKWFEGLGDAFKTAGKDIITGLIEGITNAVPQLESTVKGVAQGIKDWIKDPLKIHSPSLVMAELGEDVSMGMAKGISSKQGDVQAASTRMAGMAPVGAGQGASGASFGGIQVTNEFHLGSGGEVDQGTIDKITAAQRRVIEEVLMTVVQQSQVQS